MARRVFFSFYYDGDINRVSIVRKSWLTQPDRETAGFWDAASWESVQRSGQEAVKRWIEDQMNGTSVTVVLIGAETSTRPLVMYEIQRSWELKKGIVGVRIHGLKDMRTGMTSYPGANPLEILGWNRSGGVRETLANTYRTYDYVTDNGYANIGRWIEEAAAKARR